MNKFTSDFAVFLSIKMYQKEFNITNLTASPTLEDLSLNKIMPVTEKELSINSGDFYNYTLNMF